MSRGYHLRNERAESVLKQFEERQAKRLLNALKEGEHPKVQTKEGNVQGNYVPLFPNK